MGVEVADVTECLDCIFAKNAPAQFQHLQRDCVPLLSALDDNRRELREIRRWCAITNIDDLIQTVSRPVPYHAVENERWLREISRTACGAHRLQTDPMA